MSCSFSVVVQRPCAPTLATKISGSVCRPAEALVPADRAKLPPPSITTWAQFIYISRFPIRLNHDQAKSAGPEGAAAGTVKAYSDFRGQPPTMDLITLKVAPWSYDSDSWHEPPWCLAPPVTDIVYELPAT